jgi:hypothetical protein
MISEWGALSPNPLLDGRTFPLRLRKASQVDRYIIAIQYQPIEHECEIDVGDRPGTKEVFTSMAEQFGGGSTELSR